MKLYRYENKRTGRIEVKDYNGWKAWAEDYYKSIRYHDLHYGIKKSEVVMPKRWWGCLQKALKLELVTEEDR